MKAAVLERYGKFQWKEVPDPGPRENEVLIKVSYAGICGTDQHIFNGEFHPRSPVPFIPGHEFAGIVADTGKNVTSVSAEEKVVVDPIIWCGNCPACREGHYPACTSLKLLGVDMDGGFAEYISVPSHMVYSLASDVEDKYAALVEILSIGFHAINRAGVEEQDNLVIWGAGKVGQSILHAAKTRTSGYIILVDILEKRLAKARNAFPDILTVNVQKEDPVEMILNHTRGEGADIAFEAVGHFVELDSVPNPVAGCIKSIRGAGTVCVLGFSNDPSPVVFKELIWKEGRIVASRVSHGEFKETIHALEAGVLDPSSLISRIEPAQNIQKAFLDLSNHPEDHLKILLNFNQ